MTNLLRSERRTQNAERRTQNAELNCLIAKTKSIPLYGIMLLFLTVINPFQHKTFGQINSFTSSVEVLTPNLNLQITNTSSGYPAGSIYLWEISGLSLFKDSTTFNSNSFECNQPSFSLKVPNYSSDFNSKLTVISLKVLDQNRIVISSTNFTKNYTFSSSLLAFPYSCSITYPCTENFVCNEGFETAIGVPSAYDGKELSQYSQGWNSGLIQYNDVNNSPVWNDFGEHAELFTFNNPNTKWSSSVANNFGTQPNLYNSSNYAGFSPIQVSYHPVYTPLAPILSSEYIYCSLGYNLIANQDYTVLFNYSLAENSTYYCNFTAGFYAGNTLNQADIGGQTGIFKTIFELPNPTQANIAPLLPLQLRNKEIWQLFSTTYRCTTNGHAFMLLTGNKSQAFPLNGGSTPIGNSYAYYFIDNVRLIPQAPTVVVANYNFTIPCGNSVTLTTTDPHSVQFYQWYENDQLMAGQNGPTLTVSPSYSSIYKLKLTNFHNCTPTEYTFAVTVLNQTPDPSIEPEEVTQYVISNPYNMNYVIESPDPNSVYVWQVVSGTASILLGTGTSFSTNWNIPLDQIVGELKLTNYKSNCTYSSQIIKTSIRCYISDEASNNIIINNQSQIGTNALNFTGVVKIAANITFSNQTIMMDANSKIIVNPGCTLTIEGCRFVGCDKMWDGIYLSDLTIGGQHAKLIIKKSSTTNLHSVLEHMTNGIVSRFGAGLNITNTDFIDNLYSIKVKDYAKSSTSSQNLPIMDCFFSGNTFNNDVVNPTSNSDYFSLLIPYYQNVQSNSGIYTYNVENLTIGSATEAKNIFNRMQNGIVVNASTVKIINNEFNNIKNVSTNPINKLFTAAVNVNQTNAIMKNRPVIVGTLANSEGNQFYNCALGVYSNDNSIRIYKNEFSDCSTGISINKFNNTSVIDANKFKDGLTCISVQPPTPTVSNINITNNIIGNDINLQPNNSGSQTVENGIILTNISGSSILNPSVANNLIYLTGPYASNRFGIRTSECYKIKVANNSVKHENIGPFISLSNVTGCRIDNCRASVYYNNQFYSLGNGISTNGNLSQTVFKCNLFQSNFKGFYFNAGTALAQQGYPPYTPDNSFYISSAVGSKKLETNGFLANPCLWYFRNPSTNLDIRTNGGIIQQISPLEVTNAISMCSEGGGPSPMSLLDEPNLSPEERDFLLAQILEGVDYVTWLEEYQTYDNRMLFDILENNPDLMFLEDENDQEYIDFYYANKNANIGKFADVHTFISESDYVSAVALNESITPENSVFAYMKTVNSIYLNTWCASRYEFTDSEIETLTSIAMLTPNEAGSAVYTARILLGIDPVLNDQVNYRLTNIELSNQEPNLLVYPNPVTDILHLAVLNQMELENAEIEIYTTLGKLVYTKTFSTQYFIANINLESLKNGLYLYTIKSTNGYSISGKLTIYK